MKGFDDRRVTAWLDALARIARPAAPVTRERAPVHVVYGGAHLFTRDVVAKMSRLALTAFDAHAATPDALAAAMDMPLESARAVHGRVRDKLGREPVEDLRIDFEDGFGPRPDEEEDHHARRAGEELRAAITAGAAPPSFGVRPKALSPTTAPRALRTLSLFFDALGFAPTGLIVTLPKVDHEDTVAVAADVLDALEGSYGAARGAIRLELMIETPESLFAQDGAVALPRLARAGRGRVSGVHLGAYDLTAAAGVSASAQTLDHPLCRAARALMQLSLAGTGIEVADGATTLMPIGPHRGDLDAARLAENDVVVRRAWRAAYANVRRALADGLYQGWDLHPAQLPARYAATYAFFREGLADAQARLQASRDVAAKASRVGAQFDDAATARGLEAFFARGVASGALDRDDLLPTG